MVARKLMTPPITSRIQATVRGTRIAVELIFERLADGWTREDLTSSYPRVSDDDLRATFAFAAELIRQRRDWVPEPTA